MATESIHTLQGVPGLAYSDSTGAKLVGAIGGYRGHEETFTIEGITGSFTSALIDTSQVFTAGIQVVAVNNGAANATLSVFLQESDDAENFLDISGSPDIALTDSILSGRKTRDCYGRALKLRFTATGDTIDWDVTITCMKKN
jgi:hypothetical protein